MANTVASLIQQTRNVMQDDADDKLRKSLTDLRAALSIRAKTIKAVEYFADYGTTQRDAAEKHGVSERALSVALGREDVRTYLQQRNEERLTLLRSKATHKVGELITGARSEYVQLEAARTVLAETKRTEQAIAGNVALTIVLD
jgi:hypothetical protein